MFFLLQNFIWRENRLVAQNRVIKYNIISYSLLVANKSNKLCVVCTLDNLTLKDFNEQTEDAKWVSPLTNQGFIQPSF